jgi:hypothetical protein
LGADNILRPFGVSAAAPEPDEKLIAVLERILDRARSGELTMMAYVIIEPNGTIGTGWAGDGSANVMLGAVSGLQARFARAWLDGDD